jgi:hypothetical protein
MAHTSEHEAGYQSPKFMKDFWGWAEENLYNPIAGVDARAEWEGRQRQEHREFNINRDYEDVKGRLRETGRGGAQDIEAAMMQAIDRRYSEMGNRAVSQAASRGLIHSGYARQVGQQIQREQQGAETQARGTAADYLMKALMGEGALSQSQYGLLMNNDQMLQQLLMFLREQEMGTKDWIDVGREKGKDAAGFMMTGGTA